MGKGMKKEEALALLQKGLTLEEVPNFTNINELEIMIEDSDFEPNVKKKIKEKLLKIKTESAQHSKAFNEMMIYILKAKKDEF